MDRTIVEQDDRGTEDEVGGTLDAAVDNMHARDVALGEEGVLVADECAAAQQDAVAPGFERHGLPHPAGVVLDGEPLDPDVVGLDGEGPAIVGGHFVAVYDLAREVVPDNADAVAAALSDDLDLVLVDVEGNFLAVGAGHDPHRAPPFGFGGQRIETGLHGGEIAAAVAVDDVDALFALRGASCAQQGEEKEDSLHNSIFVPQQQILR